MSKKTAGKLNQPPVQADFNKIALGGCCQRVGGVFYRLHSTDTIGNPWPPIHFSKRGNSRFDPVTGAGSLCMAETLAGAMMELFDDHWGPVGSLGRSVTEQQLATTWVTRVSLPESRLFDAMGSNLSRIGTDAQLLTGKYTTTRKWTKRMMEHPDKIDGVRYRSRHDLQRINVAVFRRAGLVPATLDPKLQPFEPDPWRRNPGHGSTLVHGNALRLRDHPHLNLALVELEVAKLA